MSKMKEIRDNIDTNDMPSSVKVGIHYLPGHEGLPPLDRMTPGSSGLDIQAACQKEIVISPGETSLVPAGFILVIPDGYEAQIRPRSGLALREKIGVLNSPGTIDSDYRGEINVILFNFGGTEYKVHRGDRIAQLVISEVPEFSLVQIKRVEKTGRGDGGFGHTG